MARIGKVKPELVGNPGSAAVTVQKAPYPGDELARDLKSFGSDMQGIFQGLVKMGREGQNLAVHQAMADYDLEVTGGLERDVYSLQGAAAGGCGAGADRVLKSAEERQMSRLSAYGGTAVAQFRNFAVRDRANRMGQVVRYARKNLTEADLAVQNQRMSSYVKKGSVLSGNAYLRNRNDLILCHDQTYLRHAFGMEDAYSLSPQAVGAIIEKLDVKAREALEMNRQRQLEQLSASRIDALVKVGDITGAQRFLGERGGDLSEGVRTEAGRKLELLRDTQVLEEEASALVSGDIQHSIDNDEYCDGGRMLGDVFVKRSSETLIRLQEMARSDSTGRTWKLYRLYAEKSRNAYQASRQYYEASKRELISRYGRSDSKAIQEAYLGMPAGHMRNVLEGLYAQRKMSEDTAQEKADQRKAAVLKEFRSRADYKATQELTMNELLRYQAMRGEVMIGGVRYDLRDQKQRETAAVAAGLDENYRSRMEAILLKPRIDNARAATAFAEVFNQIIGAKDGDRKRYTAETAFIVAGGLVERLREIAAWNPGVNLESRDGQKILREWIRGLVDNAEALEPGGFWRGYTDRKVTFSEVLARGLSPSGKVVFDEGGAVTTFDGFAKLVKTEEQAKLYESYVQQLRNLAEPVKRLPGQTEEDFVATRMLERKRPERVDLTGSSLKGVQRDGKTVYTDDKGVEAKAAADHAAGLRKRLLELEKERDYMEENEDEFHSGAVRLKALDRDIAELEKKVQDAEESYKRISGGK